MAARWGFVAISFGIYATALGVEAWFARRQGRDVYDRRNSLANTAVFAGFGLSALAWNGIVAYTFYSVLYALTPLRWGGATYAETSLAACVALFFLDDLIYYWAHRTNHRVPLLWATHEAHHSSPFYNVTVAGREPWTAFFHFLFWFPLPLLGFHPSLVLTQQWISLTFQLIIHTQLIRKLGPLEAVLNTPSHHRVHHGTQPAYRDRNFAGILIVWDRVFGTFVPETEPPRYGVLPAVHSNSPLEISFNGVRRYVRERGAERSGLGAGETV